MVPAFALIITAVILGLGVIIWIANRRRRESALETMRTKTVAASAPAPDAIAQVRALMARGEKIEAIRVLREASGMGLADAKAAVETLNTGSGLNVLAQSSPPPSQLPAELAATVRGLLQRGDKIAAIKLVRERMKLDLKDSKDLVDRVE
jgi:ribosomal protein L7/L12